MKKDNNVKFILALMVAGLLVQLILGVAMAKELKFFGVESATVKYEHSGTSSGWSELCISNWGNLMVERRQIKTEVFGIASLESKKIITEGPWITTIDLEKNTATKIRNPMYDSMEKRVEQKGGVETGWDMLEAMGGQKTNRKGNYGGHPCIFWTLMGTESCITEKGLTLYVNAAMMGIKNTQTATEVNMKKGCSKNAAKIPAGMEVKEIDLSKILGGNRASGNASGGDYKKGPPVGFDFKNLEKLLSK